MMPLHSVNAQLGSKLNYIRQLIDVGFEKRELKGQATAVSPVERDFVSYSDKLLDVLENPFELRTLHDGLRRFTSRTVPRNLDIARNRGNQPCPFGNSLSGKTSVRREIQFDIVLIAQCKDVLETVVEQRLTHSRRNNLSQTMN